MTEPTNATLEAPNYWQELFATLKGRLRRPWRHPTFVMYFLVIIVIVGGFGLLEPLVSYWLGKLRADALPGALVSATYTYFAAIAATAAVDLILSYHQRKYLLMFFLMCSVVVFLCALFAAILGNPAKAAYPSVLGYFLALFLWWVGNANNANLLDTPVEPTAPIGANAKPSGDLAGFNT